MFFADFDIYINFELNDFLLNFFQLIFAFLF